ncbi:CASP-like protein 4B1 isoform X3 [Euphorbia lathyris]|uniref:CASP-like protein 4B1 isoform X3 n=1 Tax=Euphorbia lathyris TaxID=212925 RepID=UPI00331359A3
MSGSEDKAPRNQSQSPPPVTAPPAVDPEVNEIGIGVITRRWKRDEIRKRGSLGLRGLGLLFSLLAFIIMASNKHGDGRNFDRYEEYRYLLAISILSTLYTGGQVLRHIHELYTGKHFIHRRTSAMVDFIGDQLISYLLIYSASTAIPLTNRMREWADNLFTDSSAGAISMTFMAFFLLGMSALLSGYDLSTQSYI